MSEERKLTRETSSLTGRTRADDRPLTEANIKGFSQSFPTGRSTFQNAPAKLPNNVR